MKAIMSALAKKIISNPETRKKLEAALKNPKENIIRENNKSYRVKKVSSLDIE